MSRCITLAEVKEHNSEQKGVWLVIHNEVFDVTKFLDEHPGGADSLLEFAGTDGTQAFEDVGHSDDARSVMTKFRIGQIPPGEINRSQPVSIKIGLPERRPSLHFQDERLSENVNRFHGIRDSVAGDGIGRKWWKLAVIVAASAIVVGLVMKKYKIDINITKRP